MIRLDMRRLTDALLKLQRATEELPAITKRVEQEALGHAILGARRNVYDTPAGLYERTEDYLRGFHTRSRSTRFTGTVQVWNDVEYAAAIEYGQGPHEVNAAQVQAIASPNPAAPVYLGRQGADGRYVLPGPAVIPATVFAVYRMRELFAEEVRKAVR